MLVLKDTFVLLVDIVYFSLYSKHNIPGLNTTVWLITSFQDNCEVMTLFLVSQAYAGSYFPTE